MIKNFSGRRSQCRKPVLELENVQMLALLADRRATSQEIVPKITMQAIVRRELQDATGVGRPATSHAIAHIPQRHIMGHQDAHHHVHIDTDLVHDHPDALIGLAVALDPGADLTHQDDHGLHLAIHARPAPLADHHAAAETVRHGLRAAPVVNASKTQR
jgi:hypothetical protein